MLSIGVLVTNYNSWDLAYGCINAHLHLHGGSLNGALLLDDNSSLQNPFLDHDGFQLICNDENLGFAANLNKGVRVLNTDIVVIFDADAVPLTPYYEMVLREFESNPRLGLLGFETVDKNNEPTASWHKEPSAFSLLLGQQLYTLYQRRFEKGQQRICIPTAAMAVRREAFEAVNGFDPAMNFLDVDFDLSMSLNRADWEVKVSSEIKAFHEGGGTPMLTSERVFKFYTSRWPLMRKHELIKNVAIAKWFIVSRLIIETMAIGLLGKLVYRDPSQYSDKIRGRRKILRHCWNNYA